MIERTKSRPRIAAIVVSLALAAATLTAAAPVSATEAVPPSVTPAPSASPQPGETAGTQPEGDSMQPEGDIEPFIRGISAASFDPDNIISDRNMYAGSAMDGGAVQEFLQQQVPVCRSGYTCLTGFTTKTDTMPASAECTAYTGRASERASAIIAAVGKACGVSQRVLLVLLQKESELVYDDWPGQRQYDQAMGFDCPDTGECNPEYAGFFKQVYWAAWQFANYRERPEDMGVQVGVPERIDYSPKASCNTTPPLPPERVVRNIATASLYEYTPYQPNAAALSSTSDGDSCSSYGNLNVWVIYSDWFGFPQIDVDRVSGTDRYAGAVAIAEAAYPSTAPVVFVANGQNYPDALSAGPAAVKLGGPLLLTDPGSLPSAVAQEVEDLKPERIVVVGGVNSVSEAVKTQLGKLVRGASVERIGGASRYETSRLLVQDAFGTAAGGEGAKGAYLATGANFPDALSAGGAAGFRAQPVVLVDGAVGSLDSATQGLLKGLGVTGLTVVGGPNSVSAGVYDSAAKLAKTTRVAGIDRYDTSQKVNAAAYQKASRAFLATGTNFPDALAGSAWAGAVGGPLYVVPQNCLPGAVRSGFKPAGVLGVTLLGGPNSLSDAVARLQPC
jgi:putative cell wall-binding protein